MATRIDCPHCDQPMRLPDELYDREAQCPRCHGGFTMRWRRRRPMPGHDEVLEVLPATASAEPARQPCRFCGKGIRPEAVKCPFCREWLDSRQ